LRATFARASRWALLPLLSFVAASLLSAQSMHNNNHAKKKKGGHKKPPLMGKPPRVPA